MKAVTNVVGFDDAPFAHEHRGDVRVVGAVCSRTRLDGVLSGKVRRDGRNATDTLIELVRGGKFREHVRGVLLQGIALAGFNVVDLHRLSETLDVPVVVAVRRHPRLPMVEEALRTRTPGGLRKWRLVQAAGPLTHIGALWVQHIGIDRDGAAALLAATTLHGNLPEPLRLAHLIAGGVTTGQSRGRA
ncbi:MAG TPA: DUF99 family protein [Kofleriaceae bacterium]|nr:DUF99 family protein [Kofleriaceae bacterium]